MLVGTGQGSIGNEIGFACKTSFADCFGFLYTQPSVPLFMLILKIAWTKPINFRRNFAAGNYSAADSVNRIPADVHGRCGGFHGKPVDVMAGEEETLFGAVNGVFGGSDDAVVMG